MVRMRSHSALVVAAAVAVLALTAIVIASVPQRMGGRTAMLTKPQQAKQASVQLLAGVNAVCITVPPPHNPLSLSFPLFFFDRILHACV